MKPLASITNGLIGQPMFNLLAKAREMERSGARIIHFEIGDPNFNSPLHAIEAAKAALDDNFTHYTDSMGTIEFREAIAAYTELHWGFKPSVNQILVCPANTIIDFASRCVVNPGEGIIYPDPGFPTYTSVINYNGMVPMGVPLKEENAFRMNPDDAHRRITDSTRLIIINTPQNPTGSVMTKEEVLEMARIAADHDLYLLSDEVYSKITYGKHHYSPSSVDRCQSHTIILGSLSKIYSMSGWRLGYAVGPEKLIQKMGLLLQTILSCLPVFTQVGGKAALLGDQKLVAERNKILKDRRDLLVKGLNRLPGVSCLVPDGSFYAFPNIKNTGMTSDDYSEEVLRNAGVCALSGNCFGRYGEGYVRFCYASTPVDVIEEALGKLSKYHKEKFTAVPGAKKREIGTSRGVS